MLQPAVVESRVIPNGVDLTIYKPGDRRTARADLRIPADARVFLITSNWARNSPWRDFKTLQQAVGLIAERITGEKVIFLALGEARRFLVLHELAHAAVGFPRGPRGTLVASVSALDGIGDVGARELL